MRKILASLFALVLLLGACTDDDSSSDDEETTETTGTDASGDEGTDGSDDGDADEDSDEDADDESDDGSDDETDPDDQARVDAALAAVEAEAESLGYTVTLEDPDADDEEDDLVFESDECQEADRIFNDLDDQIGETAASQVLDAQRGEFVAEDSVVEQVAIEITATPSTDDVALGFDGIESIDIAKCIAEGFEAATEEDGVTAENVVAESSTAGRGDRDILITIQADFSSGGVTFPVDIVFTLVAVDRDVVFASALTFNDQVGDDAMALVDTAIAELG